MTRNVKFHYGNMLTAKSDLLVVPLSKDGTINYDLRAALEELGYTLPSPEELYTAIAPGSIKPIIDEDIVLVVTVDRDQSTPMIIEKIGRALGEHLQKNPHYKNVASPLLGSGGGGLDPLSAYRAFMDGFIETAPPDTVLNIYIIEETKYNDLINSVVAESNEGPKRKFNKGFSKEFDREEILFDANPYIIVTGTGNNLTPDEKEIARQCGRILAENNYNLITVSWSGVNTLVVESFKQILIDEKRWKENCAIQYVIDGLDDETQKPVPGTGQIHVRTPSDSYKKSVDAADAIIMIGGKGGAGKNFTVTMESDIQLPYFPIYKSGGDAALIYDRIKRNWDNYKILYPGIEKWDFTLLESDDNRELFKSLVYLLDKTIKKKKNETLIKRPEFISDTISGDDLLNRDAEIESFAMLIASNEVKPPLSIGIFGDWGAGKSFFMQKIEERVAHYSMAQEKKSDTFCDKILQIRFNAWHYIDTNLFASLVSHIFEELSAYLGNKSKQQEHELELYNNLEFVKKLKEDIKEEKELLKRKLEAVEFKNEINKKKVFVKTLITTALDQSEPLDYVKERLGLDDLKNKPGLKELHDNADIQELNKEITALDSQIIQFNEVNEKSFTHIKEVFSKHKWWNIIIPGSLILVSLAWFALPHVKKIFDNVWPYIATHLTAHVTAFIVFVPRLVGFMKSVRKNKLHKAFKFLEEFREKYSTRIQKAEEEHDLLLRHEQETKTKLMEAELKEKHITNEISIINKGKLLAGFILNRLESDQYQQHLGIISIIRKDFERLSEYLHDNIHQEVDKEVFEKAVLEKLTDKADRECVTRTYTLYQDTEDSEDKGVYRLNCYINHSDKEQLKKIMGDKELRKDKKIERIVLYIDDLDRCPPDKVIDVLQAIHLLLAFPIFVAVVGVDARWISKSLLKKYDLMFTTDESIEQSDFLKEIKGTATPYDYLEKIFQIPFRIKPINNEDKAHYINSLLAVDRIGEDVQDSTTISDKEAPEVNEVTAPDDLESLPVKDLITKDTASKSVTFTHDDAIDLSRLYSLSTLFTVTDNDRTIINELLPIIGRTPRTIKRFINVFRLIKSNNKWIGFEHNTKEILVLLAVIIGQPAFSVVFADALNYFKPLPGKETLMDFITAITSETIKNFTNEEEKATSEFYAIKEYFSGSNEFVITLRNLNINKIKSLAPVISRFSFRHTF